MNPVRTEWTEMVYRGTDPEVGDLWCHRHEPGVILSVWEPTDDERRVLINGGRVVLTVMTEPIPPVALYVLDDERTRPVGKHQYKVIPELEERDG